MATASPETTPQAPTRPPRSRRHRGRRVRRPDWLTPAVRVRAFTLLIALVAIGLYVTVASDLTALPAPFPIPWPLAALAFYLGETNVVEVHFLRERHSFSLSELPGIVGLFFLPPTEYLLACLVGTGFALLADRQQSSLKRAFNLAQFGLAAVVALSSSMPSPRPPSRPGRRSGSPRSPRPARRARSRRPSSPPRSRCRAAHRSSGSSRRC